MVAKSLSNLIHPTALAVEHLFLDVKGKENKLEKGWEKNKEN